jgi:hypothetical protein
MPTLRQKVDNFCKESGAKVDKSNKLRVQINTLKSKLRKAKEAHVKASHKTRRAVPKAAKTPKAPKVMAEPMMPAAPGPSDPRLLPTPATGRGRAMTRRRLRPNLKLRW